MKPKYFVGMPYTSADEQLTESGGNWLKRDSKINESNCRNQPQ